MDAKPNQPNNSHNNQTGNSIPISKADTSKVSESTSVSVDEAQVSATVPRKLPKFLDNALIKNMLMAMGLVILLLVYTLVIMIVIQSFVKPDIGSVERAENLLVWINVLFALVFGSVSLYLSAFQQWEWWTAFYQATSNTFILAAMVSFVTLSILGELRDSEECLRLFERVSSSNNNDAIEALDILVEDWVLSNGEQDNDALGDICQGEHHSLSSFNLEDANLARGDLSNLVLTNTQFNFANLATANFTQSQLNGASFRAADLTGALLEGTDLSHSRFTDAILINANLSNANLYNGLFRNANLSGATLTFIRQENNNILVVNAGGNILLDFSRAILVDSISHDSNFSGAAFVFADLENADLSSSIFIGADLRDANLKNTILVGADFSSADLGGANLTDADINLMIINDDTHFTERTRLPDGNSFTNHSELVNKYNVMIRN